MARRKEFDPDQALAKAMAVFWRLGYENTSLELLLREMGIAKQSLYDTYGDKRGLSFDLRQRIEAEEAKEALDPPNSASGER